MDAETEPLLHYDHFGSASADWIRAMREMEAEEPVEIPVEGESP